MAEIQKVSPTHDSIMDWLLTNPGATLEQMGGYFGYSVAWLSQLINSDLFQERYRERRGEIESQIASNIPEKMAVLAQITLAKLTRHVEKSEDPTFLHETADMVLHRLGYAPSKTVVTSPQSNTTITQNVLVVERSALAEARGLLNQLGHTPSALRQLEHPSVPAAE